MNAIAFDTHASFKRLKDAGLNDAQAEAVVEVVSGTADLPDISQLATKADLAVLKADVASVETRLEAKMTGLEAKMTGLEARLTALKGELVWWIIGTGVVVAMSQTLQHILGK